MKSKIVRFWCVAVLATLFFSAPSFAQAEADSSGARLKTKRERSHFAIDTLKVKLALTLAQETKILEILDANREQAKQDHELYKGIASAQARLTKERFDKTDKEILAVLDANQKKKYEAFKKERWGRRRETQKNKTSKKDSTGNTP